jgi:hypothetical protein
MPIPLPKKKEPKAAFISRCMGDPVALKDFPLQSQRAGVCYSQWKKYSGGRRKRPVPTKATAAATELLRVLREVKAN